MQVPLDQLRFNINFIVMCFIFGISKYILVPIITEWLEIRELVLLDSSVINRNGRSKLYNMYKEFPGNFSIPFQSRCIPLTVELIKWMDRTSLVPNWVDVSDSFLDEQEEKIPILIQIHSVQVNTSVLMIPELYSMLMYHFPLLKNLRIYYSKTLCTDELSVKLYVTTWTETRLDTSICDALHLCSNLVSLQINRDVLLPESLCIKLAVSCRQLQNFEIFFACLDPGRLRSMQILAFHAGKQFTKLLLQKAGLSTLKSLLWYRCGTSLKSLTLSNPLGNASAIMNEITAAVPNITELRGNFMPFVTSSLKLLDKLKSVELENVKSGSDLLELINAGLHVVSLSLLSTVSLKPQTFGAPCPVRVLNLSMSIHLTNEILQIIGQNCKMIEELNVRGCTEITDFGMMNILANRRLSSLNIVDTKLSGLTLKNLVKLDVPLKHIALTAPIPGVLEFLYGCTTLEQFCYNGKLTSAVAIERSIQSVNPKLKVVYSSRTFL